MRTYVTQEATMAIPEAWVDASTTALTYDDPEGEIRVMVAKAKTEAETFDEALEELVAQFQQALPRFELLARGPRELDGRPGADLTFTYRDGEAAGLRRLGVALRQGDLMMIAVQGRPEQRPALDDLAELVLSHVEWRSAENTP